MARLGTLRVDHVLEYERDIKGKGLVRLRAGVGSGKNYWARHLLEKHPDLQILIITSRKNVAEAEALRLDTNCKIEISKLIDARDKEWYEDFPGNTIVCTYAYIEHFFENIYSIDNPQTHLWNKFDLIIVDEVHAITLDASFADSPFYVERFIHHTLRMNSNCDVVVMSGTMRPAEWLFTEEHWGVKYVDIDLYDQCIHLVPDKVYLLSKDVVADRIARIRSHGHRLVYFVNSVNRMAVLITELEAKGISEDDIGIAYSSSENAIKLPASLRKERKNLRKHIVENASIPANVKIFITTSQNKEGINIEDDDIRFVFAESHCKTDLEQMAGRIRGNPETGTGLYGLVIVHDAPEIYTKPNYIVQELDRILVDHAQEVIDKHKELVASDGMEYKFISDIKNIHKNYAHLRYDYIGRKFMYYSAKEQCAKLIDEDAREFAYWMNTLEDHLFYEWVRGGMISVTGGYELNRWWFPYSKLYRSPGTTSEPKEDARAELLEYLQDNDYLDIPIDTTQQAAVMEEVLRLITKYGERTLGFKRGLPKTLGPALKKFILNIKETKNHDNNDKIITATTEEISM